MKITRRQLRRIIEQASPASPEDLEPERFRSKEDAEDMAVGMVFGDEPNARLGGKLPWEVRIISIDDEYALYAMRDHRDRYAGAGKEYAAVPRGGAIRYGRRIG